ncbi:MAG: type II toxin-antitoxin system death-on-curing family toxin [Holosporales bacterium]|nr:type II toxin-antitoxin system death-on-curing family toxin [Holosporales bacterium]
MAELFESSLKNVNDHISNILKENELATDATIRNFRIVRTEGKRTVSRDVLHYNLDMIISVGYRIKSRTATNFRIWATNILRTFMTQGVVLNEKLLKENQKQLDALKRAITLLDTNIQTHAEIPYLQGISKILSDFATGLRLLTAYDNNALDDQGRTRKEAYKITPEEFASIVQQMRQFESNGIFGVSKDDGFNSAVEQIYQTFGGVACYPTIEEKAAMLLYLIVKNHAFLDGNKRIAASCFLYFLAKNGILYTGEGDAIVGNEAIFSLTLLIANSHPGDMQIIKQVIISILNCRTGDI